MAFQLIQLYRYRSFTRRFPCACFFLSKTFRNFQEEQRVWYVQCWQLNLKLLMVQCFLSQDIFFQCSCFEPFAGPDSLSSSINKALRKKKHWHYFFTTRCAIVDDGVEMCFRVEMGFRKKSKKQNRINR